MYSLLFSLGLVLYYLVLQIYFLSHFFIVRVRVARCLFGVICCLLSLFMIFVVVFWRETSKKIHKHYQNNNTKQKKRRLLILSVSVANANATPTSKLREFQMYHKPTEMSLVGTAQNHPKIKNNHKIKNTLQK